MSSDLLVIQSKASVDLTHNRILKSVFFSHNGEQILNIPEKLYVPRTYYRFSKSSAAYETYKEKWNITNDGYESGAPIRFTELHVMNTTAECLAAMITPTVYNALTEEEQANYRPVYRVDKYTDPSCSGYNEHYGSMTGTLDWEYGYSNNVGALNNVSLDQGVYKLINFDKYTNNNTWLELGVDYCVRGKIDGSICYDSDCNIRDGIRVGTAYSKTSNTQNEFYYHPAATTTVRLSFGAVKARIITVDGEEKVEVVVCVYDNNGGNAIGATLYTANHTPFDDVGNGCTSYTFICPTTIFGSATASDFGETVYPNPQTGQFVGTGDFYYIGESVRYSSIPDTEIPVDPSEPSEPADPEPTDPDPLPTTRYAIWVTQGMGYRQNLVYNGSFFGTYKQDDYIVRLVNEDTLDVVSGGITWHYGDTVSTFPTLMFSSVCSYATFYAVCDNQTIRLDRFTIEPKLITASTSHTFMKYYDGDTDAPIPKSVVFNYSGIYSGDDVEPVPTGGTYSSSAASSSNNPVTITFSLVGEDASNYRIEDLVATGQIVTITSAQEQSKDGYSIKLVKSDATVISPFPSEVLYESGGYTLVVYHNSTALDDNSSTSYDASWIYGYSGYYGSYARIGLNTTLHVTNSGDYTGKVYVTDSTFPAGYAYIGSFDLSIIPVINVSWIASSYTN